MQIINPTTDRQTALIFTLADRTYAIPATCVAEIVPMAELSTVPGSPSFLSGFLNIAGRLTAVVSLRQLFGMPGCQPRRYSPLVILQTESQPIALEVDAGLRIAEYSTADLIPLSDTSSLNSCATALIHIEGISAVLLSVDHLLLEQEQKRLAELAQLRRQRLDQLEAATT